MIYGEKFLILNESSIITLYGRYDKNQRLNTSDIKKMRAQLIKCAESHKFSDKDYKNWTNNDENVDDLKKYKLGYCWVDDGDDYIVYCFNNEKFYEFDHESSGLININNNILSDESLRSKIAEYYTTIKEGTIYVSVPDADHMTLFRKTKNVLNKLFKDFGIDAIATTRYARKFYAIDNKFIDGNGSTYVYMIKCSKGGDGPDMVNKFINNKKQVIEDEINKVVKYKVINIEVKEITKELVIGNVANVAIKYSIR